MELGSCPSLFDLISTYLCCFLPPTGKLEQVNCERCQKTWHLSQAFKFISVYSALDSSSGPLKGRHGRLRQINRACTGAGGWWASIKNRCHQSGECPSFGTCHSWTRLLGVLNNECQSHRFHQTHGSCAQWLVTHPENRSCKRARGRKSSHCTGEPGKSDGPPTSVSMSVRTEV